MKKLIFLTLLIGVFGSGCSFLPRLNFGTPGTVPQATERSKAKDICKGKAEFNDNGDMISCSHGYYSYAENHSKKERKMTFTEKIKNFINNLVGASFWIFVILIILIPGFAGWIISRVLNATNKAFSQTVEAIKKFRKTSSAKEELDNFLRAEQDAETKKLIATKRVE
jgi:hypothetical protein